VTSAGGRLLSEDSGTPEAVKKPKRTLVAALLIVIIVVVAAAAFFEHIAIVPPAESYWPISTPEEQGMNATKLNQMVERIDALDLAIDSVLVVRHGYLVLEEYRHGYNQQRLCELYSATKSVISSLIGIAIEKGSIDDLNQKIIDIFPERIIDNVDSRKANLTIEHLLTMTAGFEWNDWDPSKPTSIDWVLSPDLTQFSLDRPMAYAPGEKWEYCNGASHLLSAIIAKTTGYTTYDFAREFLFSPLNITNISWLRAPDGVERGDSGLCLTPRDMAKLGYLYLKKGTWNGQQIVPAEWVAKSTTTHCSNCCMPVLMCDEGYGYQWWTSLKSTVYWAYGARGQAVYVAPELDVVVVFTANITEGIDPEPGLLYRFVFPACNTDLGNDKYSKYGLTFDYPHGMAITEGGEWFSWTNVWAASEVSGQVKGQLFPERISVTWDTAESALSPQIALDEFCAEAAGNGVGITWSGPLVKSTKDDHELMHQFFNFTSEGQQLTGIIGAWRCDETNRIYTFYYMTLPEVTTQQDLLIEFGRYLDLLTCHQ
jgi:CubicO group peptidase (beta-lactamase class C family)